MKNAKLSRVPRMCLGMGLVFLALPARAQAPQGDQGWEDALRQAFGHVGEVKVWKHEPSGHPACTENEEWSQTYEDSFLPGGVRASIKPEDSQRFSLMFLSIRPLKPGADLPSFLRQVAEQQGSPPHCFSSKEAQLQLAWAGHWITLSCGCAAGDMVYYEAGDLLSWLEGLKPGSLPEQVFFSLCGRMELEQVKTAWLREKAREKRSFWGREFPAARGGAPMKSLVGVAKNAKSGAVLLVEGQGPIYIEGLAGWPANLLDKRVEASGRLVEEKLIPDPGPDEHGAYSQGAEGNQTVLKTPTYKLAP